jgi:hypothetical protein
MIDAYSLSLAATSLALLAQTFHGRDRGTAFGVWGAANRRSRRRSLLASFPLVERPVRQPIFDLSCAASIRPRTGPT